MPRRCPGPETKINQVVSAATLSQPRPAWRIGLETAYSPDEAAAQAELMLAEVLETTYPPEI
jgi:hypothetical protein